MDGSRPSPLLWRWTRALLLMFCSRLGCCFPCRGRREPVGSRRTAVCPEALGGAGVCRCFRTLSAGRRLTACRALLEGWGQWGVTPGLRRFMLCPSFCSHPLAAPLCPPQPTWPPRGALPHRGWKGRLRQVLPALPSRAAGAGRGPPAGPAARPGEGVRAGEGRAQHPDWGRVRHVFPLPGKDMLTRDTPGRWVGGGGQRPQSPGWRVAGKPTWPPAW